MSREDESLLVHGNLKGLDHLAKLSMDDTEFKMLKESKKEKPNVTELNVSHSLDNDSVFNKQELDEEPQHFQTADAATSKTPIELCSDHDVWSIPTNVELVEQGRFDDLVSQKRPQEDDSKVLSSILPHDSSYLQSQSFISMMNNPV